MLLAFMSIAAGIIIADVAQNQSGSQGAVCDYNFVRSGGVSKPMRFWMI
jgi:hypothetical protein